MTFLCQIKAFQKSTEFLIVKMPFMKVCRDIIHNAVTVRGQKGQPSLQIQASALEALQEATEAFLVSKFESKF